jgi:demethylmenaquinone methyltransferase/2-methoxy-6-polyprenyl-1,4-benzoquinol methylase
MEASVSADGMIPFEVGNLGSLQYILHRSHPVDGIMPPQGLEISIYPMKSSSRDRYSDKQESVRTMFDGIARRYDVLNHVLSSGFDILWRKKAIRLLRKTSPKTILDVATGTADFAIEAARLLDASVIGLDLSEQMLQRGTEKVRRKGLESHINLEQGQAEALRFENESFDAVTVAFGVRNFADIDRGLTEMFRVLRPGGTAMVLEFSKPRLFPFKQLYRFYFHNILPRIGGYISNRKEPYRYLPNSVEGFPDGNSFLLMLQKAGFVQTQLRLLTFGIATIYTGTK